MMFELAPWEIQLIDATYAEVCACIREKYRRLTCPLRDLAPTIFEWGGWVGDHEWGDPTGAWVLTRGVWRFT